MSSPIFWGAKLESGERVMSGLSSPGSNDLEEPFQAVAGLPLLLPLGFPQKQSFTLHLSSFSEIKAVTLIALKTIWFINKFKEMFNLSYFPS